MDIKCNVAEGRKTLGNDVLFMGNVDTYTMTCDPKDFQSHGDRGISRDMIDAGVDAVMPGCDLWPDIIDENMLAVRGNHA